MAKLSKKIQGALKLASRKLSGKHAPFEINIHITDKCNLQCSYCYSNFYKRRNDDIPTEKIIKIIGAFKDMGVLEVSLIGGEPFLHPGFPEIVDYIKSNGLFCSTVTNGYFINRFLETAKKLDMVCVSIDGPEEINDITRGKGSFKRIISGLEALRRNNINASIRATLQRHNLNCVDELVGIAKEYKAILNFGLLFPQSCEDSQVKAISKETPDDLAYKKALIKIIALKKSYPGIFFNSLANLRNALNWPTTYTRFFLFRDELREFPDFKPIPCYGGRAFATIDTDGKIYPCTNLIGYYDAPNVLKMDIKEAWGKIQNHGCSACFYLSSVEKNLVCGLNLGALFNLIRVKRLR